MDDEASKDGQQVEREGTMRSPQVFGIQQRTRDERDDAKRSEPGNMAKVKNEKRESSVEKMFNLTI